MSRPPVPRANAARALFQLAGAWFAAGAVLFNPLTVRLAVAAARALLDRPGTAVPPVGRVLAAELAFAVLAVACLALAAATGGSHRLGRFLRRGGVQTATLAVMTLAVPVATLEVGLRPWTERLGKRTALFMKDDTLGWRMRPDATQTWGGVSVRTNARGLRGPALPHAKPAGVHRVLYLGDSVTFGYGVARDADTFALRADSLLAASGLAAQTINAAVGGYSPWQQFLWLREEGVRYTPDVIVVGFVLNDVTERFDLVAFGGQEEAVQLRESYTSRLDRVLAHSAIAYQVRNFAREIKARRRLGDDVRLGAIKQEMLDVETLMRRPEQQNVRLAWEMTLADLARTVSLCRERGARVLVVCFPFAVQLEDAEARSTPQRVLAEWAHENGVPFLDLLPALAAHCAGTGERPADLFLDHDHFSPRGHALVAELLAPEIAALLR
jgi:lysophospholipase L1-like esterase